MNERIGDAENEIASVDSVIAEFDNRMETILDQLQMGQTPMWEAQQEMGKTLITLSSGAIVVSITFTQAFMSHGSLTHKVWLLPCSWFFFAVCVLIGLSRLAWSGTARSFRFFYVSERSKLHDLIKLHFDENKVTELEQSLEKEVLRAFHVTDRATKIFNVLNVITYYAFFVGLFMLILFAILNLPI